MRKFENSSIAEYYISDVHKSIHETKEIYLKEYKQSLENLLSKDYYNKHLVKIIGNFINGVRFINSLRLCHRDLKPNNIMLNSRYVPKIIDFGSACPNRTSLSQDHSDKRNNPLYIVRSTRGYYATEQEILHEEIKK